MGTNELSAEISRFMAEHLSEEEYAAMFSPDGLAKQCTWACEDGWRVGYTTTRIRHGKNDGKFAAMAYKPTGKGARSRKASEWVRVYFRTFATRKSARKRAEAMYYQHSPKAAERHGIKKAQAATTT